MISGVLYTSVQPHGLASMMKNVSMLLTTRRGCYGVVVNPIGLIYIYVHCIYMVCLPPFNIFLIYMVNIETYTIHIHTLILWECWSGCPAFRVRQLESFVGFHGEPGTCICSRKHVIFTCFPCRII